MSGFLVLLEVVAVFGILGFFAIYAVKKTKQRQSQIVGINGKMHLVDSMSLSLETKAYVVEVQGENMLVVVGTGGNSVTKLNNKDFAEMMKDELGEVQK